MALNDNYKEEYLEQMKRSVILVDKSDAYKDYDDLRNALNKKLEITAGVHCYECESYLNKETGEIILFGGIDLDSDKELKEMFNRLSYLYMKKKSCKWNNDVARCIDIVLELGKLKDMEKAIVDEFGKKEGYRIIYELKSQMLEFEKENGFNFFTLDFKKFNALRKLDIMTPSKLITVTDKNNAEEELVTLIDIDGNEFIFEKCGQIAYENDIYFTFELKSEIEYIEYKVFTYRLESTVNGQVLLMEEDEKICDKVWETWEILTVQEQIAKNKKIIKKLE